MRRFFIDRTNGRTAALTGDDANHISRVLRMQKGDVLSLCDADGNEYDARIESMEEARVLLSLSEPAPSDVESACRVTICQCLPKAGKMELVIQKCTELGASAFVPVWSARCVSVPKSEQDFEKKLTRWRRISLEAAKQSRRALVPSIAPLTRLDALDPAQSELFLVAYEDEHAVSLKSALQRAGAVGTATLLIGPEGGFAPCEVEALQKRGAVSVSLGKRILRTETAGMVMLAQTLYEVEA